MSLSLEPPSRRFRSLKLDRFLLPLGTNPRFLTLTSASLGPLRSASGFVVPLRSPLDGNN